MLCNEALADTRSRGGHYIRSSKRQDASESADTANPPRETSDEGHKLIQIFGASPADGRAEHNNGEAKHVLLPFDESILLPAPGEESVLHDPNGREKLQRGG